MITLVATVCVVLGFATVALAKEPTAIPEPIGIVNLRGENLPMYGLPRVLSQVKSEPPRYLRATHL